MAHKWARWLHNPCRLGGGGGPLQSGGQNQKWPTSGQGGYITPAASGVPTALGKIRSGPQLGKVATYPCRLGGPHRFRARGRYTGGPQVGKVATEPTPPGGLVWAGLVLAWAMSRIC